MLRWIQWGGEHNMFKKIFFGHIMFTVPLDPPEQNMIFCSDKGLKF